MPRVLCTALTTDSGPHFQIFQNSGWSCDAVNRSLNLWDPDVLARAISGYDAILAGSEPYTPAVLASNPKLRVLSRYGVGFDAINLAECPSHRRGDHARLQSPCRRRTCDRHADGHWPRFPAV
jgi:hypothetical protein